MDEKRFLTARQLLLNLLAAYGLSWLWSMIALNLFRDWLIAADGVIIELPPGPHLSAVPSLMDLVVWAPITEEALFRLLPLTLILINRRLLAENFRRVTWIALIVVCGCLFGLAHGSLPHILVQGVGGLILGLLFLANCKTPLHAYLSCVACHSLFNLTVVLAGMAFGHR